MPTPIDSLHIKIASVLVHCEELLSPTGHDFDRHAIEGLLQDAEVRAFLAQFPPVLLPNKRGGHHVG